MEDLESMIKVEKHTKSSSKNKSLLQNGDYLFYFLALLFTKK